MSDFDDNIKEILAGKTYPVNNALWAKTQVGLKTAFYKMIIVKSMISIAILGSATVASLVTYNYFNEESPVLEAPKSEMILSDSEKKASILELEQMSGEHTIISKIEPEKNLSLGASTDVNTSDLTIEKVSTKDPKPNDYSSTRKQGVNPSKTLLSALTSTQKSENITQNKKSLLSQTFIMNTKSINSDFFESNNKLQIQKPIGFFTSTSLRKNEIEVSAYSAFSNRFSLNNESITEGGTVISSNGIAVNYWRNINKELYAGIGLETNNSIFTNTLSSSTLSVDTTVSSSFVLDSAFIGQGWVYDDILQTWVQTDSAYSYIMVPKFDISIDSTYAETEVERISIIKSVNIPLRLKYKFYYNRWQFEPSVGVNTNIIHGLRYYWTESNSEGISIMNEQEVKRVNLGITGSATVGYLLNKNTSIISGLTYTNNIIGIGGKNKPKMSSSQVAFRLGVSIKL